MPDNPYSEYMSYWDNPDQGFYPSTQSMGVGGGRDPNKKRSGSLWEWMRDLQDLYGSPFDSEGGGQQDREIDFGPFGRGQEIRGGEGDVRIDNPFRSTGYPRTNSPYKSNPLGSLVGNTAFIGGR